MARKPDLTAYPIRIRFRIPGAGLGWMTEATEDWLWDNADGHERQASYGGIGEHILTVYLRRIEDASGFMAAFPLLELADDAPPSKPRPLPCEPASIGRVKP